LTLENAFPIERISNEASHLMGRKFRRDRGSLESLFLRAKVFWFSSCLKLWIWKERRRRLLAVSLHLM